MNCEQLTGLRRQVCEGRIALPGGGFRVLSSNEQSRLAACYAGEPIPERDRQAVAPTIIPKSRASARKPAPKLDVIGVGSELHSLLAAIGINEASGCGCKQKAAEMDSNGIAWCEANREGLTRWMMRASEERLRERQSKLLWLPQSARMASTSIVAGQMLDEAVRRTRAKLHSLVGQEPIAVGITTAPRGGECLLPRCVESVLASGFDDVTVFAEPESNVAGVIGEAAIVTRRTKLGAWQNWMQTLEDLLEHDADLILIVQDDCVFSQGVADFVRAMNWPDYGCAAIQLCCSSYYRNLPRGVNVMPGTGMVGAWATVMHRFYAVQILRYGREHGWRGHHKHDQPNPVLKKAIDDGIGYMAQKLGYHCRIVKPSIVLHDADVSSLFHGNSKGSKNNRATIDWVGEKATALDHVPLSKERVTWQK